MCAEGRLLNRLRMIWIQWRGMKKIKYIPFLVNYILFPISILALKRLPDNSYPEIYVEQLAFLFIPALSIWWPACILQEYIEGDGAETLRLYEQSKLADVCAYLVLYYICIMPLILCFMNRYPRIMPEIYLRLFAQCIFSVGAVYMFSFMFQSITAAFIPVLAYDLFAENRIFTLLSRLQIENVVTTGSYVFCGIVFFLIGVTYHRYIRN